MIRNRLLYGVKFFIIYDKRFTLLKTVYDIMLIQDKNAKDDDTTNEFRTDTCR